MGEADKRGKEEVRKEDVEQEEEGCKRKRCEQHRHNLRVEVFIKTRFIRVLRLGEDRLISGKVL